MFQLNQSEEREEKSKKKVKSKCEAGTHKCFWNRKNSKKYKYYRVVVYSILYNFILLLIFAFIF